MPLISDTTKNDLATLLAETAKKPKPLTVAQLVKRHKTVLGKMLKNGHSHDDIVAVLATEGITFPTDALITLLTPAPKKKRGRPKVKEQNAAESNGSAAQANNGEQDSKQDSSLQTVTQAQANTIAAAWKHLSTIRKGLTKQELVAGMIAEIDAALEAGYDYDDLASLMLQKGIKIAASSLQKYHRLAVGENQHSNQEPSAATSTAIRTETNTAASNGTAPVSTVTTTSNAFMEDFDDDE